MRGIIVLLALVCAVANGQEKTRPVFDVASIKPSEGRGDIKIVPGSVTLRNVRLNTCIGWAYEVQDFLITGPGWLTEATFEIVAKAGTPANTPELRVMMQNLLADRFKLALHRETKTMSALILTIGKNGHKLTPNEVEGSPSFKTGNLNLSGDGATVSQMTDFLSRQMRQPVVDQTGLTGRFNYFLDINAYITEEMKKNPGPPPEAPSILAQAVQSQLGLKIEAKRMPIEVLVVDHVEKTPTEN